MKRNRKPSDYEVSGLLYHAFILLFTVIFSWFMCFDVLYDFKYFIAVYALFTQLAGQIYYFFPCHAITFPFPYNAKDIVYPIFLL